MCGTDSLTVPVATVINSDLIPFKQRGMYQAMQNILVGFGAVLGASLGGMIAETIGWRWCFLSQVPVSILALVVGYYVLENPPHTVLDTITELSPRGRFRAALEHVDLWGSLFLVVALLTQLVGLTFGGNEYAWDSLPVVGALIGSSLLLAAFVGIEASTTAIPMIPLRMLSRWQPVAVQLTNVFSGMAAYAVSWQPRPTMTGCRPANLIRTDSTCL